MTTCVCVVCGRVFVARCETQRYCDRIDCQRARKAHNMAASRARRPRDPERVREGARRRNLALALSDMNNGRPYRKALHKSAHPNSALRRRFPQVDDFLASEQWVVREIPPVPGGSRELPDADEGCPVFEGAAQPRDQGEPIEGWADHEGNIGLTFLVVTPDGVAHAGGVVIAPNPLSRDEKGWYLLHGRTVLNRQLDEPRRPPKPYTTPREAAEFASLPQGRSLTFADVYRERRRQRLRARDSNAN